MQNRILCKQEDPKKLKLVLMRKKNQMANENLHSITTMVCNHCNEKSGTPSTSYIDDETILKRVGEILGFTRMNNGEFNEEDLQSVVKNTEVLLKSYHKNEAVRKIYMRYQNMWRTYAVKEQIEDEYNNISRVKIFNEIKERYSPNTIWIIYSFINADFIERFGVNLKQLPHLKKFLTLQASKYVAKKSDTFSP